jgi:hypothetical protein
MESAKTPDAGSYEEERSWRDPSAHKTRSVVATWLDYESTHFSKVGYI